MQRRNFLKTIAAGTVGAAATAAHAVQLSDLKSPKWDYDVDVVVVGFGGAGACAAIEAHDAGAKVLVLEKTAEGGGNTSVSAGGIMIPKDKAKAYEYLEKTYDYAQSEKDEALLKIFTDEIVKQREFLMGLGEGAAMGRYGGAGFPTLPNADVIDKYTFRYGKVSAGPALFALYRNGVMNQRKIPVLFETPATRLILDGNTAVGVEAKKDGRTILVRAKRAVLLACGGFEANEEMLRNFCKAPQVHALGCPANTGDGILMAQAAGARLWHMTSYSCPLGAVVPGKWAMASSGMPKSGIWVDKHGRRFVNEKGIDNHTCIYAVDMLDPVKHEYPRVPCYLIFDEKGRLEGPCAGGTTGWLGYREGYVWSKDNSAEIKAGIIKKADTLEKLAELVGIDPRRLSAQVAEWNADVKAGEDKAFGRPVKNDKGALSSAIDEGPFYALELYPSLLNTQGGPKKTADGKVLDVYGEPIPHLYAAGEMGSMWGSIYQGACNNAEALVFGRLAGRAAAAEKPL